MNTVIHSIWQTTRLMEMYPTEYMKAVPMDRKRRINTPSTHCCGSGTKQSADGHITLADDLPVIGKDIFSVVRALAKDLLYRFRKFFLFLCDRHSLKDPSLSRPDAGWITSLIVILSISVPPFCFQRTEFQNHIKKVKKKGRSHDLP